MRVPMKVCIPAGVAFADLQLRRDPTTGAVEFETAPILRVIEASGLDPDLFRVEDNLSGLLVAWYQAARAAGEPADPVQEDLLREIQEEDRRGGGLSHQPGRA